MGSPRHQGMGAGRAQEVGGEAEASGPLRRRPRKAAETKAATLLLLRGGREGSLLMPPCPPGLRAGGLVEADSADVAAGPQVGPGSSRKERPTDRVL